MNSPFRETPKDELPNGYCNLPYPHVHCEFCEFTIPTVPDQRQALRDILIHIRDTHNTKWMSDGSAEFRAAAPFYGVESL